jgi:hypothetical protein
MTSAKPRPKSRSKQDRTLHKLLNLLADYDGEISDQAAILLGELRHRPEIVPPLYSDVFGLPIEATCADLVNQIEALSSAQTAVASYAFQIFHSYEQMLNVRTATAPEQQAAYASQLEQIRSQVAKTKLILAEAIGNKRC